MKIIPLKEETLWWLHKIDQQIREYSDKIALLQPDNDVMFRYYMRKLEKASNELEIPNAILSDVIVDDQDKAEKLVEAMYKSFYQETGKDCTSCVHDEDLENEELEDFCYMCSKGYENNYEPVSKPN
jgi:recombinational DNA repair ATPase RecF